MNKLLILTLLLSNSFTTVAEEELLDEIVAIVEESVILRSELNRASENIIQQFKAKGTQLPPRSVLDKQVLERMLLIELQLQKADQAGVRISDAEIDTALTRVASQNNLTLQQMQMAIENDGMSFANFRNDMHKELKTEKIRNGLARQNVNISENEIDLYLADNELSNNEVRLGHILVALDPNASPEKVNETKITVNNIYQELLEGKNFEDLAILYSAGQKAKEGGDLGWRSANDLPTLFTEQIKAMKKGEFTNPVRSASGYHIIKLSDQREPTNKMITQYNARHILILNSELVTPAQGMEIINEIYAQIQNGEDFAAIAEEKSDDIGSASSGGDMGWFQLNDFGQRFGDVLLELDNNEMSSPFQTQSGWHLIQRLGTRENDVTEELKRFQARQAIMVRKMDEEIERWLTEIRGEAFIDIKI